MTVSIFEYTGVSGLRIVCVPTIDIVCTVCVLHLWLLACGGTIIWILEYLGCQYYLHMEGDTVELCRLVLVIKGFCVIVTAGTEIGIVAPLKKIINNLYSKCSACVRVQKLECVCRIFSREYRTWYLLAGRLVEIYWLNVMMMYGGVMLARTVIEVMGTRFLVYAKLDLPCAILNSTEAFVYHIRTV